MPRNTRQRRAPSSSPSPPAPSPSPSPPPPTYTLTPNGVSLLKSRKHFAAPPLPVTLRLDSLHRFLTDHKYPSITNVSAPLAPSPDAPPPPPSSSSSSPPLLPSPPIPPASASGYDAVLSDDTHRVKVLLSPLLTPLIERGGLLPHSLVTVYDSGLRYDESVIGGSGFVLVRGLLVRPSPPPPPPPTLQWGSREGSREREHRPLAGSRGYYLALYHSDGVDLPPSLPSSPPFHLVDAPHSLITLLGAIKGDYTGQQTVIGRVISKSRLIHFGRPAIAAAYPFFFELLLLDATQCTKVTVWNSSAPALHPQLTVGQVVAVQGFKLRAHADRDDVELMVNPYNPPGAVHVVEREEYDALEPAVPGVPLTVTGVGEVHLWPDGAHVDLCGLCVWAGAVCRELARDRVQYHCFRFVLIGDETGDVALPLKLYSNSQDERVFGLRAGDVLLVTNTTLTTTRESFSLKAPRSYYAQTTLFSHVYTAVEMDDMGLDELSRRAQELTQWRDSGEWQQRQWCSEWQWDVDLDRYVARLGMQGQPYVTAISELPSITDALRFIQSRDIIVQGILTAVAIIPPHSAQAPAADDAAAPPAKRRKGAKGRKAKAVPAAAAPDAPADSGPSITVPPISSGTSPVLRLTLSDLNREAQVDVVLMDRPVPYAAFGGPGTVAWDVAQQLGGLPAGLPPLLLLLLRMIPSGSLAEEDLQAVLDRVTGGGGKRAGKGRRKGRARGRGKAARGGRGRGRSVEPLSSSQPVPARATRSSGRELRSRSQESSRRQERKEEKEEEEDEKAEVEGAMGEEEVKEVCEQWLVNKQAVMSLHLYRTSYTAVQVSVTTLFSLRDEGVD